MKSSVNIFLSGCELAAAQDDGHIDKEEQKILKKIRRATEKYLKALDEITE